MSQILAGTIERGMRTMFSTVSQTTDSAASKFLSKLNKKNFKSFINFKI